MECFHNGITENIKKNVVLNSFFLWISVHLLVPNTEIFKKYIVKENAEQISTKLPKKFSFFAKRIIKENAEALSYGITNEIPKEIDESLPKELYTKFVNIFVKFKNSQRIWRANWECITGEIHKKL